jgi:hypothetical protein
MGPEGKLARWVGDSYIKLRNKHHNYTEKEVRIKIAEERYPNGEFDIENVSHNADLFLTNRVLNSDDLNDIVIAFIRHEIGNEYEKKKDNIRLLYAVIFEELVEKEIPREVAMQGQG